MKSTEQILNFALNRQCVSMKKFIVIREKTKLNTET